MLRVGLTGGIGSGKSTVARIFEVLGIPVYYADTAARQLMNEDEEVRRNMIEHFGAGSYENDKLNSAYISSIVFADPSKLDLLNRLTHPATIRHAEQWMLRQRAPYVIKEAALIFESGSSAQLDKVIGVYAPKSLRIQRTMRRDNISREAVIERMNRQIDEEIKMKLCDFVVTNDEQQAILPQVLALHEKLLAVST